MIVECKTKAGPDIVWKAWEKMNNWPQKEGQVGAGADLLKNINQKFSVVNDGYKSSFKIIEVVDKKSFTMVWYSLFIKMFFTYTVSPILNGSLVSCKVKFSGIFSWPIRYFLNKRIKKSLSVSLMEFCKRLS